MEHSMLTREMRDRRQSNTEINLVPLFSALFKKIWLIILAAVVCGVLAFGATKFFVTPTYRCLFTAYVNNTQSQTTKDVLTSSDILASQELVQTYSKILTSNTVLMASAATLHQDYTYEELSSMVSTQVQDNTEIITVYVVAQSPESALELARAIADVSPEYVSDIVEGSSMKIIDSPELPQKRYKPSYSKAVLLGALIGMILAVAFIIIRYFMDDTVRNDADLENRFDIPVIGIIPNLLDTTGDGAHYYDYDYSYGYSSSKRGE